MQGQAGITLIISITAMLISMIALIYTVKTYLLKSGSKIRGEYTICSSMKCEDKYVSNIIIENLKDRAIVIFKIYLKIGHSYYLEIEDFEDKPLIIKPFEVCRRKYEPLDFYSVNLNKIDLNKLFENKKIKFFLIISTPDGKHKIKSIINYWDPIGYSFKNHMTTIVNLMRLIYKDKSYGSNAKYIIDFKFKEGIKETIAIYSHDYTIKRFKNFNLTRDSLISKDSLENYLYEKTSEGLLLCNDLTVYDIDTWRDEIYNLNKNKIREVPNFNWWMYNIMGPIYTIYNNYKLMFRGKYLI